MLTNRSCSAQGENQEVTYLFFCRSFAVLPACDQQSAEPAAHRNICFR